MSLLPRKLLKFALVIFLAFQISACSSTRHNVVVSESFLSKPNTVVMTHVTGIEHGNYYSYGSQGLLDIAFAHAVTDGVRKRLARLPSEPILQTDYYQKFKKIFPKKVKVKKAKEPIDRNSLKKFANKDLAFAPFDFRFLKEQYHTSHALILFPEQFGIVRNYYGPAPTSSPYGRAWLRLYLVDLDDNSVVGERHVIADVAVEEKWRTPPEYPVIVNVAEEALRKGLNDLKYMIVQ